MKIDTSVVLEMALTLEEATVVADALLVAAMAQEPGAHRIFAAMESALGSAMDCELDEDGVPYAPSGTAMQQPSGGDCVLCGGACELGADMAVKDPDVF